MGFHGSERSEEGVSMAGETYGGEAAETLLVQNYRLIDGGLRFAYRHTLFSVNATNLADRRYVATCTGISACFYECERNVVGTAAYRF